MCDFCENIINNKKELIWFVRSTYADDNICEYVNDKNCEKCSKCDMQFKVKGFECDGNVYVGVEYHQTITSIYLEDIIIRPFSESIQFNFCPFCGKQLSKNIYPFEVVSKFAMEIKNNDD